MLEPIVQIVHYSDIHLGGRDHVDRRHSLAWGQRLLPERFRQGLATADRAALRAFKDFLGNVVAADPAWRGRPTWLIDTGDGTSFGDAESLNEWVLKWTEDFKHAVGPQAKHVMIYGNHDAWPGTFPLLAPRQMDTQRAKLRKRWFKREMPTAPLSEPIPGSSGARIELYLANTVDHRAWHNALGWGVAAPDLWWESKPPMVGPSPAHDIERMAGVFADNGLGQHFRVLATHYPVCNSVAPGAWLEVLRNRDEFGEELAKRDRVSRPMIHLLIAGHTHQAFPEIGGLPPDSALAAHGPLGAGTCQVVSASLSQSPMGAVSSAAPASYASACSRLYPYQCSVLRLYKSSHAPLQLTVERITAGRRYAGPFGLVPVAPGTKDYAERMTVSL